VKTVSATEAARRFAGVLDEVEMRGETFVVVRHGRAVARIGPAGAGRGALVKQLLLTAPRDPDWADETRSMRAALRIEERRWSD
jgi:prevent-host-death family protein